MVVSQALKNIVTKILINFLKMNIKEKIMADCSKNTKEEVCGFVYLKDGEFDIIPLKTRQKIQK